MGSRAHPKRTKAFLTPAAVLCRDILINSAGLHLSELTQYFLPAQPTVHVSLSQCSPSWPHSSLQVGPWHGPCCGPFSQGPSPQPWLCPNHHGLCWQKAICVQQLNTSARDQLFQLCKELNFRNCPIYFANSSFLGSLITSDDSPTQSQRMFKSTSQPRQTLHFPTA